ncbi:MAG: MEDS domain-containing protein [Bryobacteraceae bacterium]|jgi:hypothetical protein
MFSLPAVAESASPKHSVQFYGSDDDALAANVSPYIGKGLQREEGVVVIATAKHIRAFANRLVEDGHDATGAIREGRLLFLGAEQTLALFMVDGLPDRDSFRSATGVVFRQIRSKTGSREIRAYGEMVDLLWNAGHLDAAARLERLWNEVLDENGLQLFCAYQIDVFGREFQAGVIDEILCAHTHLEPEGSNGNLHGAVSRAMSEVLGARATGLPRLDDPRAASWAVLPKGETTVLWIRDNLPDYADEILARARGYYRLASPN